MVKNVLSGLVFGLAALAGADSLPRLAIPDFSGRSVTPENAQAMSERFTAELSATGRFRVLERSRLSEIIKEVAFQQAFCNDPSCATDLGKLAAVQKIVLGSVAKVGGIYTVNIRLVDVGTGKVETNLSEDCDCGIEELLTGTLRRMARKLAGVSGAGEGAVVSLQKGEASIYVKSVPESALVLIDGRIMDGITPLTVQGLPPGRHDVRVQKGDQAATAIISLGQRQIKRLTLTLKSQETALKVLSTPTEAEIYLNAQPTRSRWSDAIAPALMEDLPADSVRITLFKPGYIDTSFSITILKNKENLVAVTMAAADSAYLKLQDRFIHQRQQRRLGFRLSAAAVVVIAAGATLAVLSQKDYQQAAAAKDILDRSAIRLGPVYQNALQRNTDFTNSGNTKATAGFGLLGTGAALLGLGLVLYF